MKPFIKWAGGKSWFVEEYVDLVRESLDENRVYYEPFLGGGSMALSLLHPRMVLCDINRELINTWIAIRTDVEAVIDALDDLRDYTDEESYYAIRDMDPGTSSLNAARFLYLNRLGFNGLYRENASGQFNVPYGKKRKPLHDPEYLREVSVSLRRPGISIRCQGYDMTVGLAGEGDFIYADPPYDGTFTNYDKSGFGDEDQAKLAEALFYAKERGATVVAHNADTEYVRDLYGFWADIELIPEKRRINSKGEGRGEVACVLITA